MKKVENRSSGPQKEGGWCSPAWVPTEERPVQSSGSLRGTLPSFNEWAHSSRDCGRPLSDQADRRSRAGPPQVFSRDAWQKQPDTSFAFCCWWCLLFKSLVFLAHSKGLYTSVSPAEVPSRGVLSTPRNCCPQEGDQVMLCGLFWGVTAALLPLILDYLKKKKSALMPIGRDTEHRRPWDL